MASSWGDQRDGLRFRRTEMWVPIDDLHVLVTESEKLVEKLETIRPIVTPELAMPVVPA